MIDQSPQEVNAAGGARTGGFALIARGLPSHDIVGFGRPGTPADTARGCHSHAEAWIDLILMAAYAPRVFQVGGLSVTLERGDLVASERFLAERWNWTYKAVRCFVTKLRAQQMLKRGATKGAGRGAAIAVLSICNYEEFQMPQDAEGRSKGRSKGRSNVDFGAQNQLSNNKINNTPYSPPRGDEAENADLQLSLDEAVVAQLDTNTTRTSAQTKKRPAVATETIDAGFEAWARVAKDFALPACRSISDKRRRAMASRIKAAGSVEAFEAVIRREVAASPFLRGKRPPQPGRPAFIAHVDFVLQQASWDKLVDGFYSGKRGAPPSEPAPTSTPMRPTPTTPQERAAAERGMSLEDYQALVDKARAEGRVRKAPVTDGKFTIDLISRSGDDVFGIGGRHEDA